MIRMHSFSCGLVARFVIICTGTWHFAIPCETALCMQGNFDKTARFHGMRACADSNARRMVYSRGIADASAEGVSGKVVLTRELGKNDKMVCVLNPNIVMHCIARWLLRSRH